jgi:hypothetical protein
MMLGDVLWNCASGIDRPTKNGDKASPVLSCPSVIFLLVRWRRLLLAFGTGEQLDEQGCFTSSFPAGGPPKGR